MKESGNHLLQANHAHEQNYILSIPQVEMGGYKMIWDLMDRTDILWKFCKCYAFKK